MGGVGYMPYESSEITHVISCHEHLSESMVSICTNGLIYSVRITHDSIKDTTSMLVVTAGIDGVAWEGDGEGGWYNIDVPKCLVDDGGWMRPDKIDDVVKYILVGGL